MTGVIGWHRRGVRDQATVMRGAFALTPPMLVLPQFDLHPPVPSCFTDCHHLGLKSVPT